ncbi:MAG TPA: hypothetical protein VLT81_06935, partial [Chondromyces sp.]|nr:hypothetical protein [Chondromyces sp.]
MLRGAAEVDPVQNGGCNIIRDRQPPVLTGVLDVRRPARWLQTMWVRRAVFLAVVFLPAALLLVPATWLVHRVYFDRTGLPE